MNATKIYIQVDLGKNYFEVFNKIGFEPFLKLLKNYSEF